MYGKMIIWCSKFFSEGLISAIESLSWTQTVLEIPFQTWQQDKDVCFEVHYADNYIIDKYIIAMVRWRIRPLTFFSSSHQMIDLHWCYWIDKSFCHIMSKLVFCHTLIDSHIIEVQIVND